MIREVKERREVRAKTQEKRLLSAYGYATYHFAKTRIRQGCERECAIGTFSSEDQVG